MTGATRTFLVSGLFPSREAVERAISGLGAAGVPRDLIDVVVSPASARADWSRRARGLGRETLRYAGAGALVGLVLGAALSLGMLALPGRAEFEGMILIQLLGPNVSTLAGAAIGAAIGLFVQRHPDRRLARVLIADPGILLAVSARSADEAAAMDRLLREHGAHDVRVDA